MDIRQQLGVSHFWKEILSTFDTFLLSTKFTFYRGSAFWKDLWCSDISLANFFPELINVT